LNISVIYFLASYLKNHQSPLIFIILLTCQIKEIAARREKMGIKPVVSWQSLKIVAVLFQSKDILLVNLPLKLPNLNEKHH
jgi:hypothetical protein